MSKFIQHNVKLAMSLLLLIIPVLICCAQEGRTLPALTVRGLEGSIQNTSAMGKTGNPTVILFWATWCRPCIKEMTAIAELYEEWQKKTGVVIYAVSIDDSRTQPNIMPLVTSRGWKFEFYIDTNGDFKRAMGVVDIPHLFVLNSKGEIVHQRTSYLEGSEAELQELIKP